MYNPTEMTEKTDEQSKSRLLSHKIKRRMLAVAISVAITSFGETIAWWRFADLGPSGGKTTSQTLLTNSVNASLFAAAPRSFKGITAGTDEEWMPECTVPFKGCDTLRLFDPVTETSHEMAGALDCPWGGDETGLSGGAIVSGAPELYGVKDGVQGDFTYECFFRTTEEGLARTNKMQPLAFIKTSGDYSAGWSLVVYAKHLWCRGTSKKTEGGTLEVLADSMKGKEIMPGVWYHAALTYDAGTKTFSAYLNHEYVTGFTFGDACSGEIAVAGAGDLLIGMDNKYYPDRTFEGEIAEARLSDAALAPEEFLRLHEATNADRTSEDPDLLCWFSMRTPDLGASFFDENPDVPGASRLFGSIVLPDGGVEASASAERPGTGDVIRGTVTDPAGQEIANTGSLAFFTNNCPNSYLRISDDDGMIGGDSFTVELFFRAAHRTVSDGSVGSYYGLLASEAFAVTIDPSNGRLTANMYLEGADSYGIRNISSSRVDDGSWHHFAMTYDKPQGTVCFYLDHEKLTEWTGVAFRNSLVGSAVTVGCSRQNGIQARFFDGWMDEVRFTGRALEPVEFLTPCPGVAENQLLRIPFDGDTMMLPYGRNGKASAYVTQTLPEILERGTRTYVMTGTDRSTMITNGGACRLEGGVLAYPHVDELERSDVTIEFFWRPFEKSAPWPSPLGLSGTAGESIEMASDGIWNFYYNGSWNNAKLVFQFAVDDGGERKLSSIIGVSPAYQNLESHQTESPGWFKAGFDGRWHHVAVTLREYEDTAGAVRTEAVTYFDYKENSRTDIAGALWKTGSSGLMMQKSNGSYNRLASWDIDEVRISAGVLTPESFCRSTSGRALTICVR